MRRSRPAFVAAILTVAAGVGLMVIHHFGGSPDDPEGWFASAGLGAPFVGAGLLALLGVRTARPVYCAAAGLALWWTCLISVVGFPLLIPATILIVSAFRNGLRVRAMVIAAIPAAALAVVTWFLVLHQDPAEWKTANGSAGSSNIITSFEAALTIGVAAGVLMVCVLWPPRGQALPSR